MQHTLYILLLLVGISCLSSCKEDKYIVEPDNEVHGTPVTVSMSIKVATYETPANETGSSTTRAVNKSFVVSFAPTSSKPTARASSGQTSLYNLWVLQFNNAGGTLKATKIANTPAPVKDMVTIDTELYAGTDQTLYLVSLGKSYSDVDLSDIKNVTELEKYTLDYMKYENGVSVPRVTKDEDVPYWGHQKGVDIIQLGEGGKGYIKYDPVNNFDGGISMRAMLAKLTLDLSYSVSGYSPLYLTVNKVPTKFAVNSQVYMPTSFIDLDAVLLDADNLKDGERLTHTWYLPPNPQGKVDAVTSQALRYFYVTPKGEAKGLAPVNGTYINLCASDTKTANNYAYYYIFLGCNTTNDFNVFPASYYNMRSDINVPPDGNDGRVISNTLKQTIDIAVSAVSQYYGSLFRVGTNHDIDAHTGMRPIEITMLRGSVSISVLESEKSDAPISQESSWLRLSTYSNYTDAYNERLKGNPNGLNTSLTLHANIPKISRLYIYNDEYEKYIMDDPNDSKEKRSLYIRFIFHAESGATDRYTVRMDQRPAFYVGQFGGNIRNKDGSYPQGLAFEAIKETAGPSCKYLSYYPSGISLLRGYYGTEWGKLAAEYDVENKVSGWTATRFLSENQLHFPLETLGKPVDAPRWINGAPDLYQYTYSNNNGFSVRYCYDKNRDSNGNGRIDDDELIWYMPSYYQNLAINFNYYGDNEIIRTLFSADAHGRYSTTMYDANRAYNVYNDITCPRNMDLAQSNEERCVRSVKQLPANTSFPTGAKVSTEDGYAVIDATGFISGSYVDNTATSFFTYLNNGRVKRHAFRMRSIADPIEQSKKVSARFRVAPSDLPTEMTWAEASGFDSTGNLSEINMSLKAEETGCAAYGSANPGKWRLPTGRELVLIEMMEEALAKTSDTGFQKLTAGKSYWSATEKNGSSAYLLVAYRYVDEDVLHLKSKANSVRCIQDLPAK